jgi:hypothetical protein
VPTGRGNKLAGQIGEHLLCAELGRRGYLATPFAGNVPTFDVLAVDENFSTLPIQVKASRGTSWQANVRDWMDISFDSSSGVQTYQGPSQLRSPDLIYVCVALSSIRDRFFILTMIQLQQVITDKYLAWLAKHNGRRPNKPDSFHCDYNVEVLGPYEDNWDLITERFRSMSKNGDS